MSEESIATPAAAPRAKVAKKNDEKRVRKSKPFPSDSFEDAVTFASDIFKFGAGQKVRRLTLFGHLNKSPDSGPSRQLITSANKYGLISGGYAAEYLELTPEGRLVVDSEKSATDALRAKFNLAIEKIAPFKKLHEQLKGNKLPAVAVLKDSLSGDVSADVVEQCVEQFIVNLKTLGLLKTISGAERVLSLEHALDDLARANPSAGSALAVIESAAAKPGEIKVLQDLSNVCFYMSPIGDEGTEHRKHSDLFLGSLIEPALQALGLKVIRADQIGKPGLINSQIIDHIIRARLVVADLSFHNPNVFYELAIRHACRLPTVQIIREIDRIPFDLAQFRTVRIDNTDIYSLIPKLESYKAEIASQARKALEDPESGDNPIAAFAPQLKIHIASQPAK
jgi:hypothetical protein